MNIEESIKILDKFTTEHKLFNIKHSDGLEEAIETLLTAYEKQKDVTKRYENMIEAFEGDFNLPFNYNDFTMFDDLKRLIQNKNKRLVKDIELLQELSFGIRYGNLKIIDKRNKLEGIIWN